MERAKTYLWVVLSGVVLAITVAAAGDGVKFPEPAYAKMPAIPSQQAMIVYRNGMETLVVESAFETESPSVGWVLPLPAEPSKLEVAEPGMLKSLNFCLRPMIIHDITPFPWWLLIFFLVLVPVACVVIFSEKEKVLIRILIIVPLVLLFAENFTSASTASTGGNIAHCPHSKAFYPKKNAIKSSHHYVW